MKVCAHFNLSPYQYVHERHDTIWKAVCSFMDYRDKQWGRPRVAITANYGDNPPCVDLYPQCKDCTDDMCFHDYPMVRYQLGPRGGVQRIET